MASDGFSLFGFKLKRKEKENVSFAPEIKDDGAVILDTAGGAYGSYGTYVDLEGSVKNEAELVNKYREMAEYPEVDSAIDDIVNEVVVQESDEKIVDIVLDEIDMPDTIKDKIILEFDEILRLLEFNSLSYDIVRRWYIDGRLYYHAIIDESNPQNGITELRYIDPRKIRKIRELKKKKAPNILPDAETDKEYYVYNPQGFGNVTNAVTFTGNAGAANLIKVSKDSIVHCTSGVTGSGSLVFGFLQKVIKPLNMLKALEDSLVIYRLSRAPERRVFYIDVGDLPSAKAEQYMQAQMTRFKNKISYNAQTGEINDGKKHMNMLEDFWFARRGGGKGTEVTNIPGGQNLSDIADIEYFQQKLFRALNVPTSRFNPETQFVLGNSGEITRDEIKFSKFVNRLRTKFSILFLKSLEKQLILKGIMSNEEFEFIKDKINFKFATDNYYAELKESEILKDRLNTLEMVMPYVGKLYSYDWIRKNVLKQTEEEIKEESKKIEKELNDPILHPVEPGDADSLGVSDE